MYSDVCGRSKSSVILTQRVNTMYQSCHNRVSSQQSVVKCTKHQHMSQCMQYRGNISSRFSRKFVLKNIIYMIYLFATKYKRVLNMSSLNIV